ncbi:ATP-binding cassette domain-containing protein [Thalassoglobus sp. JC818]|uniref:peptidase domain-containing ABC transporter n=1 Tax=Thalassoglobus sp. JC818 TaxID=3232136 RepID=UPI00345B464A
MNVVTRTDSPVDLQDGIELTKIYSELLFNSREEVDRLQVRRIVDISIADRIDPQHDAWWGWVSEAGRGLGLKVKSISCDWDEFISLAREGATVIAKAPDDGGFFGVTSTNGRTLLISNPRDDGRFVRTTPGAIRKRLPVDPETGLVNTVVVEPLVALSAVPGRATRPLNRFIALLRPELADVYMILVFAIVIGVLTMAVPLAIETLVNTVAFGSYRQPVIVLALILFSFLAFSAALRAVQTFVVEVIQRRLFVRVAADIGYRIPRVDVKAFNGVSPRERVNRFFDIVTVQKTAAQFLLDGVTLVMSTAIGMAVLAFYHPWLLGFDLVLLALIAFIILVLGRGAVATSIKESKSKYKIVAWLEDLAECQTAFRYRGGADFAIERTDHLAQEYLDARQKHFHIVFRQILFALGMQAVASTALLGLGGWLVVAGELTLGQLVAAELIVTIIVGSFAKLGKHMESFYDLMASVDKLGELFDLPVEEDGGLSSRPTSLELSLVVKNVKHKGIKSASKPISTIIRGGEHLALTGDDEGGKTTFLDLLFGLQESESGYITVNGTDVREIRLETLRHAHALVRHVEVFSGTVAENVHLQRRNVTMDDTRIALTAVGLLDEILELPDGIETQLSSTGFPLTINQQRKLMLARSIAGNPSLLLIDGLLDGFSDADIEFIGKVIFAPNASWTAVVATGRQALSSKAQNELSFGDLPAKQSLNSGKING